MKTSELWLRSPPSCFGRIRRERHRRRKARRRHAASARSVRASRRARPPAGIDAFGRRVATGHAGEPGATLPAKPAMPAAPRPRALRVGSVRSPGSRRASALQRCFHISACRTASELSAARAAGDRDRLRRANVFRASHAGRSDALRLRGGAHADDPPPRSRCRRAPQWGGAIASNPLGPGDARAPAIISAGLRRRRLCRACERAVHPVAGGVRRRRPRSARRRDDPARCSPRSCANWTTLRGAARRGRDARRRSVRRRDAKATATGRACVSPATLREGDAAHGCVRRSVEPDETRRRLVRLAARRHPATA